MCRCSGEPLPGPGRCRGRTDRHSHLRSRAAPERQWSCSTLALEPRIGSQSRQGRRSSASSGSELAQMPYKTAAVNPTRPARPVLLAKRLRHGSSRCAVRIVTDGFAFIEGGPSTPSDNLLLSSSRRRTPCPCASSRRVAFSKWPYTLLVTSSDEWSFRLDSGSVPGILQLRLLSGVTGPRHRVKRLCEPRAALGPTRRRALTPRIPRASPRLPGGALPSRSGRTCCSSRRVTSARGAWRARRSAGCSRSRLGRTRAPTILASGSPEAILEAADDLQVLCVEVGHGHVAPQVERHDRGQLAMAGGGRVSRGARVRPCTRQHRSAPTSSRCSPRRRAPRSTTATSTTAS